MTQAEIGGISPSFIVRNCRQRWRFYRNRLGFEITVGLHWSCQYSGKKEVT
jgi:uncharacterized glyoxalase superfamily protein PhnB